MTIWRPLRILLARPHFSTGYALGLASYFLLVSVPSAATRAVLAWDIGSAIFLFLSIVSMFRVDHRGIAFDAKRNQEGEWTVFSLTVAGAIMSFAAIILFSHHSGHKPLEGFYLAVVVATLALSWLTIHVSFAYRYAHEYYSFDLGREEVDRGIEFPHDDQPDYLDFIYFAFVLGMTFQVSDCNITAKKMRRLATLQGLIGFLFSTVILALSVNIAASLL
ncbi:DUF1345 domain-containing protein [Acidocella sp.]|uniref:DUF1345 domain-containing protein n=1 Tax=Acidocella sp. TaxID=50710 RepID=UPI002619FA27|nr:DUF1345 domain-containing protein [Acidocella sp.]